jgi:16S rRNA (cytosine967-C5)-methyltransferase
LPRWGVTPMPQKRHVRRTRTSRRPASARGLAFQVISQYKHGGRFVAKLLEEALQGAEIQPEDRRLAVELINGVVRRRATLDALITPHVSRPRHRIEGELWTLLQLGTYQLAFLDAIPAYAAVNESVAHAKRLDRRGWDGFVNGVLRAVQKLLTVETANEFADGPAADALPRADGRYRRLSRNVFADPTTDAAGYVIEAFSFPRWLIEGWQTRFDFAELCRIGFWFDRPAAISLRVNQLKTTRVDLLARLTTAGIPAGPGNLPEAVRLDGTLRVDSLPGFAEGLFTVQDESAMQAVDLLAPQPGATVLDLCAAPGAKTTHLVERMRNTGTVIATDTRPDRLRRIDENARRLGASVIRTLLVSPDGHDLPAGPFDAILVDVPCSNTGVLGKRPEARWRITPAEITELSGQQRTLLVAACQRLKPGGRVVYSTCSIEPEENEQIVRQVLNQIPAMSLVAERHHVPGNPADGGYQALLSRSGDLS